MIFEPDRRNTAPCILLASLKIQKRNPDAIIIVSPSDHSIQNEVIFKNDMEFALASAGKRKFESPLGLFLLFQPQASDMFL